MTDHTQESAPFPYRIIGGLEVHVELDTKTKMFCRCLNDPFHAETPNSHVCPVCLGLPGALPVPNREAVRQTVRIGLALGATIPKLAKWDRKHYFYPDLPKGYQISQYDLPFCLGGQVELLADDGTVESTIRFERAHLEEDAGKLLHGGAGFSHVDLNRAGVPLLEMVTMPDFSSAKQARRFLQELQTLVRMLGVSQADMEKGQMRCDVNINIAFTDPTTGKEVRTPITEVKNVNSTRAVERSIATESQRQYDEWLACGPITTRKGKITVGWDEDSESINLQRAKEGSADYRYMPEPDLPPVRVWEDAELNPDALLKTLPELPNAQRLTLLEAGVGAAERDLIVGDTVKTARLHELSQEKVAVKTAVNWIVNVPESAALSAIQVAELINLIEAGSASFSAVKARMGEIVSGLDSSEDLVSLLKQLGLYQEDDPTVVKLAGEKVLAANPAVVADFKVGNERVLGFLIGQTMKELGGGYSPAKVSEAIQQLLKHQ